MRDSSNLNATVLLLLLKQTGVMRAVFSASLPPHKFYCCHIMFLESSSSSSSSFLFSCFFLGGGGGGGARISAMPKTE